MRPNWFLALPVSPDGWFPERIGAPPPRVRLFHPDDLHLTVAFLGDCGEEAARVTWGSAREHPGPVGPATLARIAPMGNPRRPSALSALLDEGDEAVADYIGTHRDAWLAAAGARPDTRAPRPHCTVARPQRRATDGERLAAVRWAAGLDVAGIPVQIGALALYTWAEDRRERLFRVVASAGSGEPSA